MDSDVIPNMKSLESIVSICDNESALVKVNHFDLIPVREKCIDYVSISNCLNEELAEFGFKSFTSLDKGVIFMDTETKSQILNVLDENTLTPYVSDGKVKRISEIVEVMNEKKIPVIWTLEGSQKFYYLFKQYAFQGMNLWHAMNIQSAVSTSAALSPSGAAVITVSSAIAISFAGSMFLSLVECHVSAGPIKTAVGVTKVIVAFPINLAQTVTNGIVGFVENSIIGTTLPINVTSVYGLTDGPEISKIPGFKDKVGSFLIKLGKLLKNN